MKGAPISNAGLKAAENVFSALHKMIISTQLRAINFVDYPTVDMESNKYEIIVTGDEGYRFDQEKKIIMSNEIVNKNSSFVQINFRNDIYGQVEYAVGCIGDTVYREDVTMTGSCFSRVIGRIYSGSTGLLVKRKFSPRLASLFMNDLSWTSPKNDPDRYAIVTAAHVCTAHGIRLSTDAVAGYHFQHECINGRRSQDYAVIDIIPGTSYFDERASHNTIRASFYDNKNREKVKINGKITNVGWDFENDDTRLDFYQIFVNRPNPEKKKVFFLGQHSKRWGYVRRINHTYKVNMIECDLELKKGDSGGVLFCPKHDNPEELLALGILCMIDVANKGISYFTSLHECFDHMFFELP